jgi:hypothetical protein
VDAAVKRAKQYNLYLLGELHRLRDLSFYTREQQAHVLFTAMLLTQLFWMQEDNRVLKGAVAQAKVVSDAANDLLIKHRAGQPIPDWQISSLEADVAKVENLLEYDLNQQHVYAIEKVGIFNTDDLIDHAEEHLPLAVRNAIDGKTKDDFKAAGRCLVFQLFTASGYHALRALEAEARKYHKMVLKLSTESALRKQLELEEKIRSSDSPSGLIIINLTRMNKIYRQSLTHPDMVITEEDDAMEIFNLVTASITLMEKNLVQRGLAVPSTESSPSSLAKLIAES